MIYLIPINYSRNGCCGSLSVINGKNIWVSRSLWYLSSFGKPWTPCGDLFFQKQIHQEARASLAHSQGWHGSPKYVRGWCIQFQRRWCHHICSTLFHKVNKFFNDRIHYWVDISAFLCGGSISADFWWLLPWLPFITPTSSPRWYKYHWADPAISEPRFAMEKLPELCQGQTSEEPKNGQGPLDGFKLRMATENVPISFDDFPKKPNFNIHIYIYIPTAMLCLIADWLWGVSCDWINS